MILPRQLFQLPLCVLSYFSCQGHFVVWEGAPGARMAWKGHKRHVFLFRNYLVICKPKRDTRTDTYSYIFKNIMKVKQIKSRLEFLTKPSVNPTALHSRAVMCSALRYPLILDMTFLKYSKYCQENIYLLSNSQKYQGKCGKVTLIAVQPKPCCISPSLTVTLISSFAVRASNIALMGMHK